MEENKAKITKNLCRCKRLIFYPETAQEAEFIQRKFFAMGYEWKESGAVVGHQDDCIAQGMLLRDGKLYTGPSEESRKIGLLCTADQFDKNYLPPDQAFLLEQFNRLSAKVDALYAALNPTLDKAPMLPAKKPAARAGIKK